MGSRHSSSAAPVELEPGASSSGALAQRRRIRAARTEPAVGFGVGPSADLVKVPVYGFGGNVGIAEDQGIDDDLMPLGRAAR